MTTLVDKLVPDQLWRLVEPLLPPTPAPYGGRHRTIPARNCLAAIVFMARTPTPWRLLPAKELGCGSAATAWRRLAEWARAGVFEQLHLEVLCWIELSTRLGRHRWKVERALSWLSSYRRLGVRWDQGSEHWFAFVLLACALTCCKRL